jgi:hypothetical protein
VPVAAAREAEVVATDPQPAIGGWVGKHLVEEFAVGLLEGIALEERATGIGEAAGERVADLLELAQIEHPRRSRGGDPVRYDDAPEALGDQPGELTLELGDLPTQLGAGQTLVDRDSFEHSPHSQILGRLEGRCSNP